MIRCVIRGLAVIGVLSIGLSAYAKEVETEALEAYMACVKNFGVGEQLTELPAECLQAAQAGIPGAQYLAGEILFSLDPDKNIEQVAQWFSKAAASGHPPAMFNLSMMLFQGLGVEQNTDLASSNLRAAICSGFPLAVSFAEENELEVQCPEDVNASTLSGIWEGEVSTISSPDFGEITPPGFRFRLEFGEDGTRVYRRSDQNVWQEVKPGRFQLLGLGPNAVVQSVSDGWDYDGRWIETWSFTLTVKSQEEMSVVWVRQVNNLHAPQGDSTSVFTIVAKGLFARSEAEVS